MAEAAIVTEVPPADPRLWIVRDEDRGLLGMAAPDALGLTPAKGDALDLAELFHRVRRQVGGPRYASSVS